MSEPEKFDHVADFEKMFESKLYDPEQLPRIRDYQIKLYEYEKKLEYERQKRNAVATGTEDRPTQTEPEQTQTAP